MRPIGGELELNSNEFKVYFTDSGRSSLRLFLRSGDNKKKKYLIPNFFCEVVEKIFIEENVKYQFYNIFEDLTIDTDYINQCSYDILYVINYFGKYTDLSNINLSEKILVEDNVFFYDFFNKNNAEKWYGFNSFRKISLLADGSLIKTNFPIDSKHILAAKANFSTLKYEAKRIKYNYLYNNQFTENDYLSIFQQAESSIDEQKSIYTISNESIFLLLKKKPDQKVREQRFKKLKKLFSKYMILSYSDCYSFFVMRIKNRDKFKEKLMKKNIFLPIHWPKSTQENSLYESIISIPLFESYTEEEFQYIENSIKELL